MTRRSIRIAGLRLCGVLVMTLLAASAPAQPSMPMPEQVITLWPEGVPDAHANGGVERLDEGRVYNVQQPTLTFTPPDAGTATGTAVILCPGGGYVRLAIENESAKVARFLRPLGVATFVLRTGCRSSGIRHRCRTSCARCAWCAHGHGSSASILRASA